jgi:uncharacterized protein (DUF2336 family)
MTKDDAKRTYEAAQHLSVLIPYLPVDALVTLSMMGNEACHAVLAQAAKVETPVSAVLAETADVSEVILLVRNHAAQIAPFSLIRMVERFGDSEPLFSAIEVRMGFGQALNEDVWAALASARLRIVFDLMGHDAEPAAIDQAIVALLWASDTKVRAAYIASFIRFNRITPSLIKLALSSGAMDVVAAVLAVLSDISILEIDTMLAEHDHLSLARLLDIVGLPAAMLSDFADATARIAIKPSELRSLAA